MRRMVNPDTVVLALAAGQRGLVTRSQLLAAGVSRRAVDGRISRGLLRPLHRGVFQVSPVAVPGARELAACLACGPRALVSHRSAGGLWQMVSGPAAAAPVQVVVCGWAHRRSGVKVYRVSRMPDDERSVLEGIPITSPARTLRDLAATLPIEDLERAFARALSRGLVTRTALDSILARTAGRPGARGLRALLGGVGPPLTRSEAEERLLALVRKAGLPSPELNVRVAGCEVDFLWRNERLVAEVDGYAFHADTNAFETDRRRDLVLVSRGLRVVRVTWRQLTREPERVLARLAQALVHG